MTTKKIFRHFRDRGTALTLIEEIKARHGRSYEEVIESAAGQIRQYFASAGWGIANRFDNVPAEKLALVRPRLLVALSGGIDSAVVTYLAVRAVGVQRVLPVTMPMRPTDDSVRMAAMVRDDLGFNEPRAPYEIRLDRFVDEHRETMNALDPQLTLGDNNATSSREQLFRLGNFISRVRINILYDLQRAIRGRVLGTMNRAEYCQGYGVKFGAPDAYDFGVLSDFYKIDIQEMALRLGVPETIRDAAPSTGFFDGQTHEGELGATVEEQDIFAYLLFEKRLGDAEIIDRYGANPEFIDLTRERFAIAQHKRAMMTGIPHVRVAQTPLVY